MPGKNWYNFYPRSPCGERRQRPSRCRSGGSYFYPRSPCGERRNHHHRHAGHGRISIHALLAESDAILLLLYFMTSLFLSTLSLRRATQSRGPPAGIGPNFYPRSPCGERPRLFYDLTFKINFYPRSPCGERHQWWCCGNAGGGISIHALLAESDRHPLAVRGSTAQFLSTLSLRRATPPGSTPGRTAKISIHALLAESDLLQGISRLSHLHFYPRSPCGERPGGVLQLVKQQAISIHALLAESDKKT